MKIVYNLEYKIVDKLGRQKSTHHVGVYETLDQVFQVQQQILSEQPSAVFEIFTCEHLFS